jgi:hypothetical protein
MEQRNLSIGKNARISVWFFTKWVGVYDNTGFIQADVLASLIIKQSAVEEIDGRLKLKVATEDANSELSALSAAQIIAFKN